MSNNGPFWKDIDTKNWIGKLANFSTFIFASQPMVTALVPYFFLPNLG